MALMNKKRENLLLGMNSGTGTSPRPGRFSLLLNLHLQHPPTVLWGPLRSGLQPCTTTGEALASFPFGRRSSLHVNRLCRCHLQLTGSRLGWAVWWMFSPSMPIVRSSFRQTAHQLAHEKQLRVASRRDQPDSWFGGAGTFVLSTRNL